MKKSKIAILVAGALVAGLTLGGLGIANAATTASHKATVAANASMKGVSPVATLSRMTGLSVKKIQKLRHKGQSYASIATSMGVEPTAVVDQMLASRQAHLDALVAAGRMTAAQEQKMIDTMRGAAMTMMGFVPGSGNGMSNDTTPSMPATGMPAIAHDGSNAGNADMRGTMMPAVPATPATPATAATQDSPATPATPSNMSGTGNGMMGSNSGMGR